MKTIFDKTTHDEIIGRLDNLTANSTRQWGKMSPSQALEHCSRALEAASGKNPMKHALIGKLISWAVKKSFFSEKPMPKNSPTAPEFVIKDDPDFEATKAKLKTLTSEFSALGEAKTDGNMHSFFGKLSGKEWGILQYKHLDHHLLQFGC